MIFNIETQKITATQIFLSRFPNNESINELSEDNTTVFQLSQIESIPVTQKEIQRKIFKDAECRQYYDSLQKGGILPNGETNVKF